VAGAPRLRVATRGSALARWQAEHIAAMLRQVLEDRDRDPGVELVIVETRADQRLDIPIWDMGGKGVFVKEVQAAVLDGRADLAVHSAKDLPSGTHPRLVVAAVPHRADPRDVLVGSTLPTLGPGATIATGSVRRRAQLADLRPDLTFVGLRGNIGTRMQKIPDGGAIVMAAAAIDRLGIDLTGMAHQVLDPAMVLPQVGQGALAVECRSDDDDLRRLLGVIDEPVSHRVFDAERGFLVELGGDCDLPAGAFATVDDGAFVVDGLLASLDGHVVLRHRTRSRDAADAGRACAHHLLEHAGGRSLLHDGANW
jgi:hydroxymethylbilane synthase